MRLIKFSYLLNLLIFTLLFGCNKVPVPVKAKYAEPIGHIPSERVIASHNFKPCYEGLFFQYYNTTPDASYRFGKDSIRTYVNANYQNNGYTDSGWLSYHFMINCNGVAGRYSVVETDANYQPGTFNNDLKQQLLKITQHFQDWTPTVYQNEPYDCVTYLTYKIENGEIVDILP